MKEFVYELATDRRNDVLALCIKAFLLLLSWIYGLAVRIVLFCYKAKIFPKFALSKPVISVGNITLGGVGKTPFVQLLTKFLKEENLKPAILIRGYMDEKGSSDEASLLNESLTGVSVLIGRDRAQTAQEALKNNPINVFVADDGFQHWRLKRDLDIVLIDATNPFGNGELIPRGILREPLSSLKRADIFILTKTDSKNANIVDLRKKLNKINSGCPVIETVHKPIALHNIKNKNEKTDLSFLKGKTICSFCGIGDPPSFEDSLTKMGAHVQKSFTFIDHHSFTKKDIETIVSHCRNNNISMLVTTQKDAVKIRSFLDQFKEDISLFSLEMNIEIVKGKDEFFQRIRHLLLR